MAIEATKDSLCINQIVDQKKDTFTVEEDFIVPDVKPDILNTISANGVVCIYKKEIMDGKVKIDGGINVYVMYLADNENGNIRSLNTTINFSQTIEVEKAKNAMELDVDLYLMNLDCKVLNGRKVNIKAMLEAQIKISSNENFEYIKEINNLKDIQLKNQNICINSLVGTGNTKVYAKDTLILADIDNLAEIMKASLRITNKETKISYNKVLVKADLQIKLLYLTEDNRINTVEGNIPIMGFVDMPNISEDNTCSIKYEIKNLVLKPNSVEEHSIYVEAEIQVYCEALENRELNIIQDLYSPTKNLTFTQKRIRTINRKETMQNVCNIREKQLIEEIGDNKIYDVEVNPVITNQNVLTDRIIYEGELGVNLVFSSNTEGIETKSISIPFTFNMDFPGINSEANIDTLIEITNQNFIIMPDKSLDIKVDLVFTSVMSQNANIDIIDNIEEDSKELNRQQCSMVIYFVKPNDTLWKIAKRFGSTVDDIARVNDIADADNIQIGQQLFIPRYHE